MSSSASKLFNFFDDGFVQPPLPIPSGGLLFWIDPSDSGSYTLDGSNRVIQINDKSGNGHHAKSGGTVVAGNFGPVIGATQINGLNTMDFNGTNQYLDATYPSIDDISNQETTIFYVMNAIFTGNPAIFAWNLTTSGNRRVGLLDDIDKNIHIIGTSAQVISNNGSIRGNISDTFSVLLSYVGDTEVFRNGVSVSGPPISLVDPGVSTDFFSIGQEYDTPTPVPTNFLNGQIGEYIIYSGILSVSDRQQVENYLTTKWGT